MMKYILNLAPNPAFVIAYYGAEVEIGYWDGMAFSYCKNRNLSEEDFEQIIAGPNSEGEYVLPTLEDRVKSIEKVTTSLEDRKAKLVAKVKGALVPERVDPAELARLDAEIQSATTREQTAQAELTRIQGQIDALVA